MESLNSCCCCLLRPSEKTMRTPYIRHGVSEIFSDMLEECFRIHSCPGDVTMATWYKKKLIDPKAQILDNDDECGICEVCVGRLQDASDFKQQVQRSQTELQARLRRALPVKVEDPLLLSETANAGEGCDVSDSREGPTVKSEIISYGTQEVLYEKVTIKMEVVEERPSGDASYEVPLFTSDVKVEEECISRPGGAAEARPGGSVADEQKHTSYCCNVCLKEFSNKISLTKHKLTHTKKESKDAAYKCEKCNKSFAQQRHLKKHTCAMSCKICKKQYTLKYDLARHIRTHTGVRPYSCEVCNKTFTTQCNLNVHNRLHTGQRPYTCEICKKSFTYKSYLKEHIRLHSGQKPFNCEMCDKKFTLKHHLVRHIRTHTGQKPYSCDICSKSFMQPDNLKMHIRTHTGHKPHSCEICNKAFTQKWNLITHIKKQHAEYNTSTTNIAQQ